MKKQEGIENPKSTCTFSSENLLNNLRIIKSLAPNSKIMAIVKDNAYGHGLVKVSRYLTSCVDAFGVANIADAIVLREAGIDTPITLIEGVFEPGELVIASENDFRVVLHSDYQIEWLADCKLRFKLNAWLNLNTGMGRLGFSPAVAIKAMKVISESPSIVQPVGIMSHFACADDLNNTLNEKQIEIFNEFVKNYSGEKCFCNSAGILNFPDMQYDWVRPGLTLYGGSPLNGTSAESLGLKPVMTFRTKLIAIQKLKCGDNVGYGSHYTCPEDMNVGIAAVGYGQGYPRATKDGGRVIVRGICCPLIGRVMMDMTAIDLRSCPSARIGDKVTLWGDGLPIEEVAAASDRISYDLLTGVRNKVHFEWK